MKIEQARALAAATLVGAANLLARAIVQADGVAGIAPWNTDIMPQEAIDQCNEMYDAIINGDYVVLEGPVVDNQGNEVLPEGETFTIEELINCYFLLDNVIGELP